jgi:hypothetical protein
MTLATAAIRFATRFAVDNDAEIDLTDNEAITTALMVAAQVVSRDTYFLFTAKADLTLVASTAEYDLLSNSCTRRVFHVEDVNINDCWLTELNWSEFQENNPDYYRQANTDKPWCYTQLAPGSIRIASPPSTAAAAATYKFVAGFYEHPVYTYASQSGTELLGPTAFHDLIIDRAYLDNSKSYIAGQEGYERRMLVESSYTSKANQYLEENLSRYRKRKRRTVIGNIRRVNTVGRSRY